jgi:hypothetical protein
MLSGCRSERNENSESYYGRKISMDFIWDLTCGFVLLLLEAI